MNQEELSKYFIDQLTNGECYLIVSRGKAHYKMNRGSFKTRDTIFDSHKLHFVHQEGDRYLFSDGRVTCEVIVSYEPVVKFHFHVDYGYNRFTLRFKTFEDERIYGCGEQYTTLDLKNKDVPIWVSEHQQVMKIAKKLLHEKLHGPDPDRVTPYKNHQTYCSVPSFISSKHYAFYCHEDSYGTLHFRNGEVLIHFRQFPQSISLLTANNTRDLAAKLCELVGISPHLPSWVGDGAILAIQGGIDVLRKKYQEAKEAGIKVAALWAQDWCGHVVTSFGYQVYWNWQADEKLYAGLKEFIAELNKDGVRFLGYINTFLKEGSEQYKFAKENDFLVKHKNGSVYLIKSTTFNAGIVDLTNPTAYEWYKSIIKTNMIGYGLSGWMADFGEYLPTDSRVYGGEPSKLHNRWPTLWAKCCREAVEEAGKEDEVFFFNRAAYGHTLRYTNSMWNGDQHTDLTRDYGMPCVMPATFSLGFSGVPLVHSDIGGFFSIAGLKRNDELFIRWMEMNTFSPLMRSHESIRPWANSQFDARTVLPHTVRLTNIHAALRPYIEHCLEQAKEGIPVMRPDFWNEVDYSASRDEYSYFFGDDMYVCPVIEKNVSERTVHLPEGDWTGFWDNKAYRGGSKTRIEAPLGKLPVFYRTDSRFKELFRKVSEENRD